MKFFLTEFFPIYLLLEFSHLFIYLIIYLHQHGLKDIYFILGVITKYYFIMLFKLSQVWPLEVFSWSPCPFDLLSSLCMCTCMCVHVHISTLLLPYGTPIPYATGLTCIYPAPVPESVISPRNSGSLYQKVILKMKIWVVGILVVTGMFFLLVPLNKWKLEMYVFILRCVYLYTYNYLYIISHSYINWMWFHPDVNVSNSSVLPHESF